MPYILEVGGSTLRKVGASVTIECLAPLLNGCQDVPLIPTHKVLATRMLEAAKDILLKLFGALAPWLLGLIYKPEWISTRVKIRVTSDGEGVRVQGGELPDLQIWMQVTNLSPFSIEIDRVVAQVQLVGGVLGEFTYLKRLSLKPATEGLFLLSGTLSQHQLDYLARQPDGQPSSTIYLWAFVNCKVHNFQMDRQISTHNVRYVNFVRGAGPA